MGNLFQLFSVLLNWSKGVPRSRATIVFAILAGGVAGVCSTALIAVINAALAGNSSNRVLISEFIGLCIIIPVAGFLSQSLLVRLTAQAAHHLRLQLSHQILDARYRMIEELGIHRLLATITDDIPAVTNAVTSLPLLGTQLFVMLGCLLYLGWLSWPLLLLVIGYMFIGLLTHHFPTQRSFHYFQLMREEWDAMFKGVRGITEGNKELKLNRNRRNAFVSRQLVPPVEGIKTYGMRANTIALAASNWGQILFFIFIGLVLFLTPVLLSVSRQVLTGYTLTILFMITPLTIILNNLPILGRAQVAAEKVRKLGLSLAASQLASPAGAGAANHSWRRLELNGITHAYQSEGQAEEFSLGPVDLTFTPGELVFLIGGNGSGKTTLAKVIMGLYEPERGQICLDGKPVTAADRDDYRQNFSVVFSDFYLFDQLYGVDSHELERHGQEYLRALKLDHKVRIEEGKFSTTELSQGQRKRLALLAAYLENRPIYIFDEWASDQDPTFKQIFYYRILPELKRRGKSVIVISHDDRYYDLADRIIKLEHGQIEYDRHLIEETIAVSTSTTSVM
ncbi:MAG: ABC transporter ATP-binding protein [Candidatus Angelobacter sp. Gp1-AA117]|nr:MAG: ABC transporter ATP-binding protein [Candidatus Angelobacter sp. Gp1-AA117]